MRSKKAEKLSESPNIESATGEPIVFDFTPEEPDDTSKSAVDGIPIDEKDIEFHAKDIKKKDDSKLFVNVEGAEKLARQKERAAKKKDDELIKRLQTAANKRKKEYKDAENEKKAAKRKASKWVRNYKTKKVAKQIWRFRAPITIVIVIAIAIPVGIAIKNSIQQAVEQQRIVAEQEEDKRIIEEKRTDILKILEQIIGKMLTKEQVEAIIKPYSNNVKIQYNSSTQGMILYKNGGTEYVNFIITKQSKQTVLSDFRYYNVIGDTNITIYNNENTYRYINGSQVEEYTDISQLVDDLTLFIGKKQ